MPFVTMADTAPSQTTSGDEKRAAMVAAVIWPTSPHSEKKIAAKETMAALDAPCVSFVSLGVTGLRQTVYATPRKLVVVTAATSSGGRCEIASPMATATAIFAMNAIVTPTTIGIGRYRVASTPVVYSSLSPTISARKTAPKVAKNSAII